MPVPPRFQLPDPPEELIQEMCDLCDRIERAISEGDDPTELLNIWHTHATRTCDPGEFTAYWKAITQEEFVREVLLPRPEFVEDLTFAEARAVLEALVTGQLEEAETFYYLNWLSAQFPGSNISDLIYWPDEWFGDESLFRNPDGTFKPEAELTVDQTLAYAMRRSSRELIGTPDNIELPYPMPE